MSSPPEVCTGGRTPSAARVLRRVLGSRPYVFPPAQMDAVRADGPVVEVWPGTYAVTGQDACRTVLRDDRFAVEDRATLALQHPGWSEHASARSFAAELLSLNGSQHARLRAVLTEPFVPGDTSRLRRVVTDAVEECVGPTGDRLARGESVALDLLCTSVPALAIGRLLGLPDAEALPMAAWSDDFSEALRTDFGDPDVLARADAAVVALQTALRPYLRPDAVPEDSVTALLVRERAGLPDVLGSEEALLANLILIWSAGLDTTRSLLREVLRTVVEDPALAAVLRLDDRARTRFLREQERLHPPIAVTTRVLAQPAELGGRGLAVGSRVVLMLDAANRDVGGDPHTWELTGPRRPAVSFGGGARTCLGLAMARLVLDLVLTEVLTAWPTTVRHDGGRLLPGPPVPVDRPTH